MKREFKSGISIIIPVYNSQNYLNQCIDSVINQNYKTWELILVDDGSTDESGRICEYYSERDDRIKTYHINNSGVSHARNVGILYSSCDWICFIDSDDWVEPNYLDEFYKHNPQFGDIVLQSSIMDFEHYPERNRLFRTYPNAIFQKLSSNFSDLKILHDGVPYAKLFNRSVIIDNSICFNESLSIHEDHVFVLDYYKYVSTIKTSSNVSYHYMKRSGETLSSKKHDPFELLESAEEMTSRILNFKDALNKNSINELISSYGISIIIQACKNTSIRNYNSIFNSSYELVKKLNQMDINNIQRTCIITIVLPYNKLYWLLFLYTRIQFLSQIKDVIRPLWWKVYQIIIKHKYKNDF